MCARSEASFHRHPVLPRLGALLALAAFVASGCEGDRGPAGPAGPPGPPGPVGTNQELSQGDNLPGLTAAILSVSGGTGSNGAFLVGDRVTVNYTLKKTDNSDWDIAELSGGSAMISGPTFNYQRVIAEQNDLIDASVQQADGSYAYTFAPPIPASAFGQNTSKVSSTRLLPPPIR